MKRKRAIAIGSALCAAVVVVGAIKCVWRIPDYRWLGVRPGMTVAEIEALVGKPDHPSRDSKEMDRWIVDTSLFNSRLVVYYHDRDRPTVASGVEITRYCKLTGSYPVQLKRE